MNYKSISFYLSLFCFPISLLAFINILYSSYFDYFLNINSYVITLLISLILGFIFLFFGKKAQKKINFIEQLLLIILVYFLTSFFIALPFYFSNYQVTLLNSFFEATSGVTGTGFSIFENIKYLDPTLILWRSSSQWIGGLYFLIFLILIFSNKQFNFKMNDLTYSGDNRTNSENNVKDSVFKIFILYSALSFMIFLLFNISGVRLFNSLNITMSLISSGGFIPTNSLDKIIQSNPQKIILIFSFLISILNFFLVLNLFNKKMIIKNHKEDLYLIVFSLILILLVYFNGQSGLEMTINVLSSLSNSGLSLMKSENNLSLYFLLIAIFGGSLISNTSGIKFTRIYILVKSASYEIIKLVSPNNIINKNIFFSEKKITDENIKISFLIFISFFISLFILSGVLIIDSVDFEETLKLSILTITNTTTSPIFGFGDIDFANLLTTSKLSLIIFMIIGKIELISIFLIIKKILFKD